MAAFASSGLWLPAPSKGRSPPYASMLSVGREAAFQKSVVITVTADLDGSPRVSRQNVILTFCRTKRSYCFPR